MIQEIVEQEGSLHKINPTSVNTVRFMNFNTGKEIFLLSAILRIGGSCARVNNAHSGGIFCGIDQNGYTKERAWNLKFEKFTNHLNGNEFKNS